MTKQEIVNNCYLNFHQNKNHLVIHNSIGKSLCSNCAHKYHINGWGCKCFKEKENGK